MKHLTTDELVDRLYGVGAGDHLNDCAECSERFQKLRERREMAAEPAVVSHGFLAAQRREYLRSAGREAPEPDEVGPGTGRGSVFAGRRGGRTSSGSKSAGGKSGSAGGEAGGRGSRILFADVYSMEQSMELFWRRSRLSCLFEQDQQQ